MPLLYVQNTSSSTVSINADLGTLPAGGVREYVLTSTELDASSTALIALRSRGVIDFNVRNTATTEDDEFESLVLSQLQTVPAARYVAADGSDAEGRGTQSDPYKTIERALADVPILALTASSPEKAFVIWVKAPYDLGPLVTLQTPSQISSLGGYLDFGTSQVPYWGSIYIASWSDSVNSTTDPRFDVLKGPLTPVATETRDRRFIYTFNPGTFAEADNTYTCRQVRCFDGVSGEEKWRGCVVAHEGLGQTLTIQTHANALFSTTPQTTDRLYIVEPTVKVGSLGLSTSPGYRLFLVGFQFESLVTHGPCDIDLVGSAGRGSSSSGVVQLTQGSSFKLSKGSVGALPLSGLEQVGLNSTESGLWRTWCSSIQNTTGVITTRALASLNSGSDVQLEGVVSGAVTLANGQHTLWTRGAALINVRLELSDTVWICLSGNGVTPLLRGHVHLFNCTANFTGTLKLDVAHISSNVFDCSNVSMTTSTSIASSMLTVAPWDVTQNTLPTANTRVILAREGCHLRVNGVQTVFGNGGVDVRLGATDLTWAAIDSAGRVTDTTWLSTIADVL